MPDWDTGILRFEGCRGVPAAAKLAGCILRRRRRRRPGHSSKCARPAPVATPYRRRDSQWALRSLIGHAPPEASGRLAVGERRRLKAEPGTVLVSGAVHDGKWSFLWTGAQFGSPRARGSSGRVWSGRGAIQLCFLGAKQTLDPIQFWQTLGNKHLE